MCDVFKVEVEDAVAVVGGMSMMYNTLPQFSNDNEDKHGRRPASAAVVMMLRVLVFLLLIFKV